MPNTYVLFHTLGSTETLLFDLCLERSSSNERRSCASFCLAVKSQNCEHHNTNTSSKKLNTRQGETDVWRQGHIQPHREDTQNYEHISSSAPVKDRMVMLWSLL